MKKLFKKAVTVLGSVAMIGATVAGAAAAAYPTPFGSDSAVVVGANSLDVAAAMQVASDLGIVALQESTTSADGDSYMLEKSTNKFNFGDTITSVITTSLDDDELSHVLAQGTYVDDDNDEFEFKQKIEMAGLTLTLFDDNNYKRDTPTIGFDLSDNDNVLNYTLDFTTLPLWDDLTNTDLTILGKSYYVLSVGANNDTLTLLDSADTIVLNDGESKVVDGKTVSISIVAGSGSTATVKLQIDGEVTNSLSAGDTQKLSDGSYVGIKEISVQDYAGGAKQVEFSIGSGKMVLASGSEVEMNGEDIDNLKVYITNNTAGTKLDTIKLVWNADGDMYVTEDSSITMPGFEAVALSFGGMVYPTEEEFVLEADGDASIVLSDFDMTKDADVDLNLLYWNGTHYVLPGLDADNQLATAYSGNLTFVENTHDYFVVSYKSGDTAESYLVRAASFDDGADSTSGTADDTVKIEYRVDGAWVQAEAAAVVDDVVEIGSASMTIESVNDTTNTMLVSATSATTNFHMLYSAEGLEVWLPWINTTAIDMTGSTQYATAALACAAASIASSDATLGQLGYNHTITYNKTAAPTVNTTGQCVSLPTSYTLTMEEEDKDGAISSGPAFTFTLDDATSSNLTSVTAVGNETPNGGYEVGQSTKDYLSYISSALNTKIMYNSDGDQDYATVTYHGGESYGKVYISEPGTVASTSTGAKTVLDTETSAYEGKNIVVVGGSCINSVAAKLLGGAYCGEDFTTATGVGAGQFMFKAYDSPYTDGKVALLVAGYEKADTEKAVTYLLGGDEVSTAVGEEALIKNTAAETAA